ncbi:MAG: Uma2 family endonuclease [Acidimicrobiales bacterium]
MALRLDLTAADLDDIPADGRRWELLDGVLHVTPPPSGPHQKAVGNLHVALHAARRAGDTVFVAPFAYRPSADVNVEPDLLVVDAHVVMLPRAVDTPYLVVEVLSPSTRADDLGSKRILYERLGVPNYWIVDPLKLMMLVLTLDAGGVYQAVDHGPGGVVEVAEPFPVTIDLDGLLAP